MFVKEINAAIYGTKPADIGYVRTTTKTTKQNK